MEINLPIGGFVPTSLVDWPDMIVSTVFLSGCPWKCVYCHNKQLQDITNISDNTWSSVLTKIKTRVNVLEGVVFSGGEATIHKDLIKAIKQVTDLGLPVGIHSAGTSKNNFIKLIDSKLISWVGLDIKALPSDYTSITGSKNNSTPFECLSYLINSGIDYQVRITKYLPVITPEKEKEITDLLINHYKVDPSKITFQECIIRGEN